MTLENAVEEAKYRAYWHASLCLVVYDVRGLTFDVMPNIRPERVSPAYWVYFVVLPDGKPYEPWEENWDNFIEKGIR